MKIFMYIFHQAGGILDYCSQIDLVHSVTNYDIKQCQFIMGKTLIKIYGHN